MTQAFFSQKTFKFLSELAKNNQREWFNDNKQRYEQDVRAPALEFIEDMAPRLHSISPHFRAISRKTGGSLMRIYRDLRFSKDKTPYKTNIGIQFRHEVGKDIHAPGFYVHIEPGNNFLGAGIWRPDGKVLRILRDMLMDNPKAWKSSTRNKKFSAHYQLSGESLINPPRGYPKDHALIEDLKRKDFIAIHNIEKNDVLSPDFSEIVIESYKSTAAFMRYLCTALDINF